MRTGTIDFWFYDPQGKLIGATRVTLAGVNRVSGWARTHASYSGDAALIGDTQRLMIYGPELFDAWNTIQIVQVRDDGWMFANEVDPNWLANYMAWLSIRPVAA